MQVKKQQLELHMKQLAGSKLERSMTRLHTVTLLIHFLWEYIVEKYGLDDAQTGIKIAGRITNNLRYADDTTLIAESDEELKSLLMRVKEEVKKLALQLNVNKTKIMISGSIISWQIEDKIVEVVTGFLLLGSKNHCGWWLYPWN